MRQELRGSKEAEESYAYSCRHRDKPKTKFRRRVTGLCLNSLVAD